MRSHTVTPGKSSKNVPHIPPKTIHHHSFFRATAQVRKNGGVLFLTGIRKETRTWERGRENGSFPVAGVAELPYYSDVFQRQGAEGPLSAAGRRAVRFSRFKYTSLPFRRRRNTIIPASIYRIPNKTIVKLRETR